MSRAFTRAPVMRLWLAVFTGYLGFGATLQLLPGWMHTRFGSNAAMTGLAIGVAFAATAVGRPFAGRASDQGLGRATVAFGGVLTAVGALVQGLAWSVPVLLVGRIAMGAGEAALFSGALPWVLAGAVPARRGRVAGWFGLSMWGGLALGPILAAGVTHVASYRLVWDTIIGLGITAAALVVFAPAQLVTGNPRRLRPAGWWEIVPRGAALPGVAFGLAAYGYGTVSALVVLYLTHDLHGGSALGLAVFAGAFLVVRWAGSPAVDRFGAPRVAIAELAIEAIGLMVLSTAATAAIALAGAGLAGAGLSLAFPSTVSMTLARTTQVSAGGSVGATTSFWDLGLLVAGILGGVLADTFGYRSAFGAAAIAPLAALLVIGRLARSAH